MPDHSFTMIYISILILLLITMVSTNVLFNNYKLQKISIRVNRIRCIGVSQNVMSSTSDNYLIIKHR